jgi:hypothetical protein
MSVVTLRLFLPCITSVAVIVAVSKEVVAVPPNTKAQVAVIVVGIMIVTAFETATPRPNTKRYPRR